MKEYIIMSKKDNKFITNLIRLSLTKDSDGHYYFMSSNIANLTSQQKEILNSIIENKVKLKLKQKEV